ncbi:MAG: GtrA family protein [Candidatus Latescibacteria bacterium]|nr:GtrA family protein [Candidatus Latescibacterota bacterium]
MISTTGLVRGATDSARIQFFRYGIVGGTAFLADFGSLIALKEIAGVHYLVAAALAFLVGLTVNYALSVRWVFATRRLDSRWAEFGVFGLIGLVGLGLNELVIWQCTETLGLHYLASKCVAAALVLFWNFSARRRALFQETPRT